MKTSLKVNFLVLLVLPFIACASFYTFTMLTEKYNSQHPSESALNTINTSNDIDKLRDYALTYMKGYIDTQQSNTKVHYSFVSFLLALAMVNTIMLYSIYKHVQQTVTNKSSKPTTKNVSA